MLVWLAVNIDLVVCSIDEDGVGRQLVVPGSQRLCSVGEDEAMSILLAPRL